MLRNVAGWTSDMTCVPTALCAVTGLSIDRVAAALSKHAGQPPRGQKFLHSYNIIAWLKALAELGATWTDVLDHSDELYKNRATIELFMTQHQRTGTMLVFGENEDISCTHLFAAEGRYLVDTYTGGKAVKFTQVPTDYNAFRIKRIFAIT